MPLTQVSPGLLDSQANAQGFRNRIINGDCRVDQRNAGAAVTPSSSTSQYVIDRWRLDYSQTSKITAQRDTTAPAGFTNALKLTVAAAVTPGASDYFLLVQPIEGYNVADLAFGTASASTITISFKVRSSVTGTYAVAVRNGANNRSYVGTYTINSANTSEDKTVTLTGDTSGTWATDNSTGMNVIFDLGSGSNFNGTANTWAAANNFRTSSTVNWISNAGATFYITGVQLEKGTAATDFERLDYGRQLIQCQRYYEVFGAGGIGGSRTSTSWSMNFTFKVTKRASPTITQLANYTLLIPGINNFTASAITGQASTVSGCALNITVNTGDVAGRVVLVGDAGASTSDSLSASAEL